MTALLVAATLALAPPLPLPPEALEARTLGIEAAMWRESPSAPATSDVTVTVVSDTAPPPTSPPAAPQPPLQGGVERWRDLVSAYSWDVDRMLRIMACESGGNPHATNPSGATGLLQVMTPLWSTEFGYTPSELLDPGINVAVAYQVWLRQSYGAWVCRG